MAMNAEDVYGLVTIMGFRKPIRWSYYYWFQSRALVNQYAVVIYQNKTRVTIDRLGE